MAKYKKKECLELLNRERNRAIKSVEDKYKELISQQRNKILNDTGFGRRLNALQKEVEILSEKHGELARDCSNNKDINYEQGTYYSFEREIRKFTNGSYVTEFLNHCHIEDSEIVRLKNEKKAEKDLVEANYDQVENVCVSMGSGNKVAEYLKELGFDLSSIENDEVTSLALNVDKSKLFIHKQ